MDREALIAEWEREEIEPFAGWDFSYLAGRWRLEEPPWSYADRVRTLMHGARRLLDLGTGGGERMLEMRADWPPRVAATEGYPPNLALAAQRLREAEERAAKLLRWAPKKRPAMEALLGRSFL